MNISLVWSTEDLYDDYYRVRCDSTDVYWMGHNDKPDYEKLKQSFMERLCSCRFSDAGDKRILMVQDISGSNRRSIGQVLFTKTEEGVEIGISILQKYQGLGIGTDVIKMAVEYAKEFSNTFIARIRDDNLASQKCFLKNGFQRTNNYVVNDYPQAGKVKFRKYVYNV